MTRLTFAPNLKTFAGSLILLLPLAGCGTTDRIKGGGDIAIEDYKVRHPIVLTESPTSVDLFPSMSGGRLDSHTAKQILAFAGEYRNFGQGTILVLLPRGRGAGGSMLPGIRRALAAGGARSGVNVSTYPVGDPHLASPIRLSFVGMKAKVADQCGQWPSDLASGSSVEGWSNKPYWNFGCASQSMIAAQTSDPRDLVTPRGEEPTDTLIRSRAIESVRNGADPNTAWQVKNTSIGNVGN